MKAAKIIVPVGILAACIGASMLLVSSNRGQAEAGSSQPPPTVRVAAVQPIEWTVELDGRGSIEAEDEAVISAQVRGRVQAISRQLEIGVDVEAGEWLLTLDPTDFELEVQRREAAVASARLALERQELELDVAAAEWTAAEPPGSTVDDLVGEGPLALRRQEVAAARAELDAALADAAQARLDLDRCRITAPAAGRIHSRSVSVGEYVAPGQPLGQLWVLDQAEIRVPIPADEVAWLPPLDGAPPPLLVRSLGDRGVERWGRLVRREGEIDRRDRVLYVVAGLDDPFRDSSSERIEIGTFVEVWIPGRPLRAMPIPRASLRGSDRVLVVDEGRLYSRQVTIARMESGTAFVTDGLDAGDEICLTPLETFVEGMAVVPESVELPQPSPRIPPVDPAALAAAVVTPEPVAGEPRQTAPAALAEPPRDPRPTRAAEPTFQLGAIDIERGDGVVQIRFAIDPQAPRTTFALRSPSRYVVDFADTRLAMTTRSRPVGDGGIERIRVAEHEVRGTTRVVFDLSVDRPPVWEAESDVPTLRFASESGQP